MKRLIQATIILAGALLAASCSREPSRVGCGTVTVRLSASPGAATRATVPDTEAERAVGHVDWYVWDGGGTLVDQHRSSGAGETFTLNKGAYRFLAVANLPVAAPSAEGLTPEALLGGFGAGFTECFSKEPFEGFVMRSPVVAASVEADGDLVLEMTRVAAKVSLRGGVTFDIPAGSTLHPLRKEVLSVFLTNIPARVNAFDGSRAGEGWVNDASSPRFVPDVLTEGGGRTSAMPACTWSEGGGACDLYGYPNGEAQAGDITLTDMVTKLVVCARIGDQVMYYPVAIPGLGPNTAAEVAAVVITGKGSPEPNAYLQDNSAVRFSVTLTPWTTTRQTGVLVRR